MSTDKETSKPNLIPSASVIIIRDAPASGQSGRGIELLLLKRNANVKSYNNTWVFPGGKLDREELALDRVAGERLAAVRECYEECSVEISQDQLVDFSRWVTPKIMPRRFDTGFYMAAVDQSADVNVDNGEIVEHCWLSPTRAVDLFKKGEMLVRPPAYVTAIDLLAYRSTEEALGNHRVLQTRSYSPKVVAESPRNAVYLYDGDAGYDAEDPEDESMRHRIIIDGDGMHYYRDNKKLY